MIVVDNFGAEKYDIFVQTELIMCNFLEEKCKRINHLCK